MHNVLVHPEIPPNTGCDLHLIEPLGFSMEDRLLRRAGHDNHEYASVRRHADSHACLDAARPDPARLFAFTTHGSQPFADVHWRLDDWLVFGCETAGLPAWLRDGFAAAQRVRLPMRPGQRSLNLSNSVAVAVFEAWRQNGYAGGA